MGKEHLERLGLSQANVSQHLILMKHQGILKAERKEGRVCYSVKDKRAAQILDLLRFSWRAKQNVKCSP